MVFPSNQIATVEPDQPLPPDLLERAVRLLTDGALLVIPTETVYGLAGDGRLPGVHDRMCRVKGRPGDKPFALLAADVTTFEAEGVIFTPLASLLAEHYWPGPLTMVLDTPRGTVGMRIPNHPVALDLLRGVSRSLLVTSANRSGHPPARTAQEAMEILGDDVALALDVGPSPGGVPSTVVRVKGDHVSLLREGAVPASSISAVAAQIG